MTKIDWNKKLGKSGIDPIIIGTGPIKVMPSMTRNIKMSELFTKEDMKKAFQEGMNPCNFKSFEEWIKDYNEKRFKK